MKTDSGHSGCRIDLLASVTPIPWKEFVEPLDWMLGDACQNVSEPGLRIDTSFILAVTIRLYITAARSPPRSEPQNN